MMIDTGVSIWSSQRAAVIANPEMVLIQQNNDNIIQQSGDKILLNPQVVSNGATFDFSDSNNTILNFIL